MNHIARFRDVTRPSTTVICNTEAPKTMTDKLQRVFNAAARVVSDWLKFLPLVAQRGDATVSRLSVCVL